MARRDSLCCRSYTLELALSCRKGCAHFRRALPRDEGACGVQVNVRALASAAVPLILEPERVMARRDAAKIDGRVGEVVPADALASATAAATAAPPTATDGVEARVDPAAIEVHGPDTRSHGRVLASDPATPLHGVLLQSVHGLLVEVEADVPVEGP